MEKSEIKSVLKSCEDLQELNDEALDQLIEIGDLEVFFEGEEIFTINHKGEKFYIVLDGKLLLRLKDNQSMEYRRGQLFGEVAIFGETYRFGTICAKEKSILISFNREKIFSSEYISRPLALQIVILLTKKIVSYFDAGVFVSSKKLIQKGESDHVEFKASISKYHKQNIIRTLSAFMNLNGGTVFCGVDDEEGKILGLDASQKDLDNFMTSITGMVKSHLGALFVPYISFDIEEVDGKTILRIDCSPSTSPVFYKERTNNGEEKEYFFVRTGAENSRLKKTSRVISYVQERFKA